MPRFENLAEMFFERSRSWSDRPRYRYKQGQSWREVRYTDCADRVRAFARGLIRLGLQPGDRVALLSATRPEWMELDLAILAAGGVTVPIYPSNLPAECGYIVWNSESSIVCVENELQWRKIREVQERGFELDGQWQRPDIRHVIAIEAVKEDGVIGLDQLAEKGRDVEEGALRSRWSRIGRGELATIVYTSGTTGLPKGVLQTHGNHLSAVESVAALGLIAPGEVDFFFLPLAHSFARLIEYVGFYEGTITAFSRSIDTLMEDVREARPHFVPSVPRVYEKIYARALASREGSAAIRRGVFDWALKVGRARTDRAEARKPLGLLLGAQARLAELLVFSKVRAALGGRIKFLVSGGAPLAPEIARFLYGAGLLVLEGYGLTETTPILTVNRPDRFRFGTVGLPLDIVSLKIADDGEILAKGPNIALGYYKRPEETRSAWDSEGWFHTGDVGEVDADGFLRITDRKKDLIKTSGGKYVAPQKVENLLKTQPHISQAVVIGDRRRYCVALLTLDAAEIAAWAMKQGISLPADRAAWPQDERVRALIDSEVEAVNQQLASYESVKYYRIVPHEFTVDRGELTPSLKVKRKVIAERYKDLIEEMY